jgi:hypothetical protein
MLEIVLMLEEKGGDLQRTRFSNDRSRAGIKFGKHVCLDFPELVYKFESSQRRR